MERQLLEDIKKYIESSEVDWDAELGSGSSLEQLIDHGLMPDVYFLVLKELENFNERIK